MNIEHLDIDKKLTRDLIEAARAMPKQEARYLVDYYYLIQDDRKRAHNQVRQMDHEPHLLIMTLAEQSERLEARIKKWLDAWSDGDPVGVWLKANHGIGPVIASGLLAHIDIAKAPTAGHIWRFAGYDPTVKWEKKTKRPWNADLKMLCWKIGQSFMKFYNAEACTYGHVYRQRKEYEIARNDRGDNADAAAQALTEKKFNKSTEAYKHLTDGHLPPAQIDARARRYAVKLFLSHLQMVWFFNEHQRLPASPYALGHMDHTHFVAPEHLELVPGLPEAMRKEGLI